MPLLTVTEASFHVFLSLNSVLCAPSWIGKNVTKGGHSLCEDDISDLNAFPLTTSPVREYLSSFQAGISPLMLPPYEDGPQQLCYLTSLTFARLPWRLKRDGVDPSMSGWIFVLIASRPPYLVPWAGGKSDFSSTLALGRASTYGFWCHALAVHPEKGS